MKQLIALATSSLLLIAGLCAPAQASIISYNVLLSGGQSVPGNASTASGSATVTVDDVLNTVFVSLTFTGLTGGNASAAHIHCCSAITSTAPVVIPFTGFPTTTSGTYSNLFTGVSVANINGIEAGLAYINIHNTVFPAGEIRGDILARAAAVPEPAGVALFGPGARRAGGFAFSAACSRPATRVVTAAPRTRTRHLARANQRRPRLT